MNTRVKFLRRNVSPVHWYVWHSHSAIWVFVSNVDGVLLLWKFLKAKQYLLHVKPENYRDEVLLIVLF